MDKVADILEVTKNFKRPKNLRYEFQYFGVYLAESLGDIKHYSLYIKLAKEVDRTLLEQALNFVKGFEGAKNKGKVFMWKLKELRDKTSRDKLG